MLSSFYDDKIRWALASKEKINELANLDDNDGDNILTIGDNEVTLDIPVTLTNLVRTPPPPVRRHHQITASGRDP